MEEAIKLFIKENKNLLDNDLESFLGKANRELTPNQVILLKERLHDATIDFLGNLFDKKETTNKIFDYEKIYGNLEVVCEISHDYTTSTFILDSSINEIPLSYKQISTINVYYKYKNGHNTGPFNNKIIIY